MREVWDFALVPLFECGGMFWAKQRNGDRPSRSMKNPHSRESETKTEKKSRVLFRKGAVFLKLLDYFRQLRQMKIKKLKRFSLYVEDSRGKYHRDAHVRSDSVVVSITSHESYTAESSSSSMSCALARDENIFLRVNKNSNVNISISLILRSNKRLCRVCERCSAVTRKTKCNSIAEPTTSRSYIVQVFIFSLLSSFTLN